MPRLRLHRRCQRKPDRHLQRVLRDMDGGSDELSPASEGTGPLLQRDYWAFVESPRVRASEMGHLLATRFEELAPKSHVRFRRTPGEGALREGDELEAEIRFAGTFRVRVTHLDSHSITFGTVEGHPEAGRITFGAYPSHQGAREETDIG